MKKDDFLKLVRKVNLLFLKRPELFYRTVGLSREELLKAFFRFVPTEENLRIRLRAFRRNLVLRCTWTNGDGDEFPTPFHPNVGGRNLPELERNYLSAIRPLGDFSSAEELDLWLDSIGRGS